MASEASLAQAFSGILSPLNFCSNPRSFDSDAKFSINLALTS